MTGKKASKDEDPYKPSAPYSTGTIPRHGNRPPGADYEGLFDYEHSAPSAPPIDFMDQVSGYESVSFDAVNIPPPAAVTEQHWENNLNHTLQPSLPRETEQSARAALLLYAKNHCCYGKTAAKNMAITELKYYSAFHYELQTYTEKRETSWTYVPYSGGEIDGAENGPAPLPWDIEVHPSQLFKDEVKVIPVPHTSSVKQCHRCKGTGHVLCSQCYGKGWVWCQVCNDNGLNIGNQQRERCMGCYLSTHGKGRQDCLHCSEKGKVGCESCSSHGQIHCYIQLTVSWKVNTAEHIVDHVCLPEHHLRAATGQVAYEEEGARVFPLTKFPDEAINMAASQLIHQHITEFRDRRILAQRQQVRVIPVSAVAFEWKSHEGKFFILGYEKKVYAPDYPQKCCCCTVI